jgi:transposase-like protein
MKCPHCNGPAHKNGTNTVKGRAIAKYWCPTCNRGFQGEKLGRTCQLTPAEMRAMFAAGHSQAAIARAAGVTRQYVSKILKEPEAPPPS